MDIAQNSERKEIFDCDGDIKLEMQLITEEEMMEQLGAAFAACGPLEQFQIGPCSICPNPKEPERREREEHGHRPYGELRELKR